VIEWGVMRQLILNGCFVGFLYIVWAERPLHY
jgi:hypothetical protein